MLQSFASEKGNPVRPFNPTILQCDEHISNYKGIEAVFGKTFFEKRTASCEYHFDKSVNKHQRLVSDEDKIDYKILISGMKNAVSDAYIRVKRQLEKLIKRQNAAVSKSLTDTLNFWDRVKYRWASAFKFNLHNITRSSLAEAAQASMKAADQINILLVDAIYYGITDSAPLQAKWEDRINGEGHTGRCPSPLELSERSSRRQIGRVYRFIDEEEEIFATTEELPTSTLPLSHSSQPPKAKKKIEIS